MEQTFIFASTYPEIYRLLLPYRAGFDVQGYAPALRSRLMLGLPIFDVATTPVSCKTLLVIANFQHVQPSLVQQMKQRVTDAGGRVIMTVDSNKEIGA